MGLISTQHIRGHGYSTANEFKAKYGLIYLKSSSVRESQSTFMRISNPTANGHSEEAIAKMKAHRKGKGVGKAGKYERTPTIRAKIARGVAQAHIEGRAGTYGHGEWVRTTKTGLVFVRSSWERRVLLALELHPSVLWVDVEPLSISYEYNGVEHQYVPDFLLHCVGGIKELWEIKPAPLVGEPINKAKIEALNAFVLSKGYNGRLVTLTEIQAIERRVGISYAN